jgi:hypothetical protein
MPVTFVEAIKMLDPRPSMLDFQNTGNPSNRDQSVGRNLELRIAAAVRRCESPSEDRNLGLAAEPRGGEASSCQRSRPESVAPSGSRPRVSSRSVTEEAQISIAGLLDED